MKGGRRKARGRSQSKSLGFNKGKVLGLLLNLVDPVLKSAFKVDRTKLYLNLFSIVMSGCLVRLLGELQRKCP